MLIGTGTHLPERVIPNDSFLQHAFLDEQGQPLPRPTAEVVAKLADITGIRERRYIPENQTSVPLMTTAAEQALADAGIARNAIDGIIVAHNAGNMLVGHPYFHTVPNMAALLKHSLQIESHACFAYDLLFGCPGWIQGLIQAHQAIQMGDATHVLVVGVEVANRLLDPHDVDSMILGDGCGAAVLAARSTDEPTGVLSYATFSHAAGDVQHIYLGCSYSKDSTMPPGLFKMNGREVYKYATTWVPQVIKKALDKANLGIEDVSMFILHQANAKLLQAVAHNLARLYQQDIASLSGKLPSTIEFTGNTSVATVPTLLALIRQGNLPPYQLKPGDKVVMASVGAGMHCNALVYQF